MLCHRDPLVYACQGCCPTWRWILNGFETSIGRERSFVSAFVGFIPWLAYTLGSPGDIHLDVCGVIQLFGPRVYPGCLCFPRVGVLALWRDGFLHNKSLVASMVGILA